MAFHKAPVSIFMNVQESKELMVLSRKEIHEAAVLMRVG